MRAKIVFSRMLLLVILSAFAHAHEEFCWANCPDRSDSDEAGQFVGKRAGSAAAVAQEGAKRRPEPRRRRRHP
jgi:hypothetical protein